MNEWNIFSEMLIEIPGDRRISVSKAALVIRSDPERQKKTKRA
jgi:hypothetical protein